MNRSSLLTGLIASTAILISVAAHAAIVVTVGGVAAPSGMVSAVAPTTYNFDAVGGTFPVFAPAGVVSYQTGSLNLNYTAPAGDATQYASVGTSPFGTAGSPQSASIALGGGVRYIGLYWGSIDAYNTITITDALGTHDINTGNTPVLTPGGTVSSYVNIFDDIAITSVKFTSSGIAFEFDNLTIAAVPEASTWAMMLLGFLGLGFFGYRKSSRASGAAFRIA